MTIFGMCTTEKGKTMGFPDLCKTPVPPAPSPVPLPYPNIGNLADGCCSKKVYCNNASCMREGDKMTKTTGDEPGVNKGLKSNSTRGKGTLSKLCSSQVYADGKAVGKQFCLVEGNKGNIPPGTCLQAQTDVTVV